MLYRSTDRLCRRGAPVKNLAHSASFDSSDKDAPSKPGIKQLVVALVLAAPTRAGPRAAIGVSIGWIVAFAILYGWWGWFLFTRFESPIFPYYNSVFRSGWYPPFDFSDQRFHPDTWVEFLFYPLLPNGRSGDSRISRRSASRPRIALGMIAALAIAGVRLAGVRLARPAVFVLLWTCLSYLLWLKVFAILRYAVAIEATVGTLIIGALALSIRAAGLRRPVFVLPALCAACAAIALTTKYPEWGRVSLSPAFHRTSIPELPEGSLVLLQGWTLFFFIPAMTDRDLRFIGITDTTAQSRGYKLFDETAAQIRDNQGPVFVLRRMSDPVLEFAGEFGIWTEIETCKPVLTSIEMDAKDIVLCRASKAPRPVEPADTLLFDLSAALPETITIAECAGDVARPRPHRHRRGP